MASSRNSGDPAVKEIVPVDAGSYDVLEHPAKMNRVPSVVAEMRMMRLSKIS